MSIEQTKLFKDSIETPILRTNEVKAQQIQGNVIMQGYSLHDILFTDENAHRKIDVSELIEQKNIRYAAEQIYSFYMGTTEYRGKAIEAIHLRRDGNNGSAASLSNEVYLYADCYDENGNLIDTVFSENKTMQSGNDMVTTWIFNPHIYIHDNFKQIKFYCSTVKGERQHIFDSKRVNIRSRSIRYKNQPPNVNGNPMPSDDWKTYDQADQKAFTTDFAFTINYRQLGFIKHMENFDIHLSEDKSNLLNSIPTISQELENHKNDQTVHVTEKQKEALNNLILLENKVGFHIANQRIHVTEEDKDKWNNKLDQKNIYDFLGVSQENDKVFSTLKQGFVTDDGGKCDALCIQYSKQHFTTGKISKIQVPYVGGKNTTSYLCVQVYKEGDDENNNKPFSECVFSSNTVTQDNSGEQHEGGYVISEFLFDNLILPTDYRFVRLIFATNNTESPNPITGSNCTAMRVKIVTQQSNPQGWGDWDDDDCILFVGTNSTRNWYGFTNVIQPKPIYKNIADIETTIADLHSDLSSHKSLDIHVTQDDKNNWNNKLSEINPGDNIHVDGTTVSVITVDQISKNDSTIPTSKAIYDELYETITFNNKNSFNTSSDSIGTAVLSRKHFIQGIIDKITLPHDNNTQSTNQGGYLVIQTFDESNNQLSIDYSIEQQIYDTSKSKYEFTFDNVILPQNYSKVHLSIVQDKSTIPAIDSTNNKQFRVNCLTKSNNKDEVIVFEQDDDCRVYWRTDTDNVLPNGGNYIINFEVEYHKNKFSQQVIKENDILDKVFDYEKIDEIKYSTTDYIPQGLSEAEDSCQKIQITLDESIKQNNVKLSKVGLVRHNTNGSYNTRYYLTIRAWDKITNQVYKFYSTDSHYQSQGKIVEWNFDNVNFTDNLKDEIVIGFVTAPKDSNDFVSGTPIRIGTWTNSGSKWYKENWKVSWNNSWQNVSPNVVLKFLKTNPSINSQFEEIKDDIEIINGNISSHLKSDTHLTQDDKLLLNEIDNKIIEFDEHISSGTHLTNEINVEINKISSIKFKLDQHIDSNQSSHVSSEDRTNWNDKVSSSQFANLTTNYNNLTTKYNNLTTILNNSLADIEIFTTLDSGAYKVSSSGKCNATGIQLSREHFVTGSLKALEIYNLNGISAENIRLCAIVFHHGEDENSPKTIDDCIFSTNTCTQVETNNPGSMVFRFNNLELPDDYEFVRFLFARGTDVVPAHNDANTVIQARVQVLAQNIDGNANFTESPDDECKTLHISSTSNWYPYVRAIKTTLAYGGILQLVNRISALESRVSELEKS